MVAVTSVLAFANTQITYHYYGKDLHENDILAMYKQGVSLSCIQELNDYAINNYFTNEYTCFNTVAEVDQYADAHKAERDAAKARAAAKQAQDIANGLLMPIPSANTSTSSKSVLPPTSCAHFAYNSQPFLTGTYLFDLCNGQSNANRSGV